MAVGAWCCPDSARAEGPLVRGRPAPRFEARTWRGPGAPRTFPDDLVGRPVLLALVDLRLHSSRKLLAALSSLREEAWCAPVAMLAVQRGALSSDESSLVAARADDVAPRFTVVLDQDGAIFRAYHRKVAWPLKADHWPFVVLVDSAGKVHGVHEGLSFQPDGKLGVASTLREQLKKLLEESSGPWSREFLMEVARRSPNPHLSGAEAVQVGSLAGLDASGLVKVLRRFSEDASRRAVAAGLLGELGRAKTAPALIDALKWDDEVVVQSSAKWALAELNDVSSMRALVDVLDDPNRLARVNALWVLREVTGRTDLDAEDRDAWRKVLGSE